MTVLHRSYRRDRLHDEQLEVLIADSIGTHPLLWGAVITIEANGGIVTLTGVVQTVANRHLAELLARAQGAVGVDNRLRVESDIADAEASRLA